MLSYEELKKDESIRTYIKSADATLEALGYTEHSFAHVCRVAEETAKILAFLEYDEKTVELARIAGYLHDIGNLVNRHDHSQSGAILAFSLLSERGFAPEEIAPIVSAIGNHDEGSGSPVSPIAAALILADKSDVRRTRVRGASDIDVDIHDRVNFSVTDSHISLNRDRLEVRLSLRIDPEISSVLDYFEIFTERMLLCRKAATVLGLRFRLFVNGQALI